MAMINEVQEGIIATLFEHIYEARQSQERNADISTYYGEFLRNIEILKAAVTDKKIKQQYDDKIKELTQNVDQFIASLDKVSLSSFDIEQHLAKTYIHAMIDMLQATVAVFHGNEYITTDFLLAIRERLVNQLFGAVQTSNSSACWTFIELVGATITNYDIVSDLKESIATINKKINTSMAADLQKADNELKRQHQRQYWVTVDLTWKLEAIIEILERENLINTAFTKKR